MGFSVTCGKATRNGFRSTLACQPVAEVSSARTLALSEKVGSLAFSPDAQPTATAAHLKFCAMLSVLHTFHRGCVMNEAAGLAAITPHLHPAPAFVASAIHTGCIASRRS